MGASAFPTHSSAYGLPQGRQPFGARAHTGPVRWDISGPAVSMTRLPTAADVPRHSAPAPRERAPASLSNAAARQQQRRDASRQMGALSRGAVQRRCRGETWRRHPIFGKWGVEEKHDVDIGAQAAAYAAAHGALFPADPLPLAAARLARQLDVDLASPIIAAVLRDPPRLDPRGALLVLRGATNAVCTSARMQAPNPVCSFCADPTDALSHLVQCRRMVDIFCGSMGSAPAGSAAELLARDLPNADRVWVAYVDVASVSVATRHDVAAWRGDFLPAAAGALLRAHLRTASDDGALRRRVRTPRARGLLAPA